jgi:UV excision repair protein RAD23
MKVAVKTLTGKRFDIEAEPTSTIGECKMLVEQGQGFPADGMKLICDGKVLKDDTTLGDAGIKEGSFLVCYVSKKGKKKVAAPSPAATSAPVATPEGSAGTTSQAAPATPAPAATEASPARAPTATTAETVSSTVEAPTAATSNETAPAAPAPAAPAPAPGVDAAALAQVIEISGTDEDTATVALRAAFGDVNRAIQYVFDPSSMPQVAPPQAAPAQQAPTGAPGSDPLEQLRNDPRLDQLRTMVQQNPASLQAVMRGIEQSNPGLFAIIQQNPAAFVAMLNEPPAQPPAQPPAPAASPGIGAPGGMGMPGGMNPAALAQMMNSLPPEARAQMAQQVGLTPEQLEQMMQTMANLPPEQLQQMMGSMGSGMGVPQQGPPPGTIQVNLTADDQAAIARLEAMGLGSRAEIVQVYLACDRNENQAANILMDQAFQ